MTESTQTAVATGGKRAVHGPVCPSCGEAVAANAKWCNGCGFTGSKTMEMFPDSPPPLMPVLDAAELWKSEEIRAIELAREKFRRRYPQFKLHVWTVMLPPETKLSTFGFWLLNVCPLYVNETAEERSWSVLLLVNAATGEVAAVPGYSAGRWLGDLILEKALSTMSAPWKSGRSCKAVIRFFESICQLLDQVWKIRVERRGRGGHLSKLL